MAPNRLPTVVEALAEPFAAFPSWFLHIECDRCGCTMRSHAARCRERTLADILHRMRHDGLRRPGREGRVAHRH